jgi:adenosylcobinamide kinase/adenosylcobinamide-phosphate guanylyltransferase
MGRIILVTGGAKSGKSTETERQVKAAPLERVAYIATQANEISDEETAHNIALHRQQRPAEWATIEAFRKLDRVIKEADETHHYDGYLLDCLTLWTSNLFFDELPHFIMQKHQLEDVPSFDTYDQHIDELTAEDITYFEDFFKQETDNLLKQMRETDATFWLVTNEIGLGVVPHTKQGRLYREWLGKVNQAVAKEADQVFLTVSGIPLKIKDSEQNEN